MTVHDGNPLLGLAAGFVCSLLAVGVGGFAIGRFAQGLPRTARVGIFGAVGLGVLGLFIFLMSAVPFMFPNGAFAVWALFGIFGLWKLRADLGVRFPSSSVERVLLIVFAVLLLLRLPAALSPSDSTDWDSISHQMAMAKIWLEHGRVDYIPFMHQSNIPATVNMLYCFGLQFGGQFGAKSIAFFYTVFALISVGGLAAHRYGTRAGYWAAIAFVATPVVLWETGSAYVDVAHGLYSGLALVFAALWLFPANGQNPNWLALSGICLGFSLGTKYTGLQFALAIMLVVLGTGMLRRRLAYHGKALMLVGIFAFAIGCPWYIRNVVNTGNPVYPFFYNVFGGGNWSQANADAYSAEQKSFGIGHSISQLPGSITALALQPDKQINQGTPFGAIGPLFLLGILWWAFSGRARKFEGALIAMICISLLSWFVLTQQSRYIIALVVPGALLVGGAVASLTRGDILALASVLQLAWSLILFSPWLSPVAQMCGFIARPNESQYLSDKFPFAVESEKLNRLGPNAKIALFDEPRGYYLDVEYWWANPGHSMIIDYDKLQNGADFVRELLRTKTTHVYMNLEFAPPEEARTILASLQNSVSAPSGSLIRYRWLIMDALVRGLLQVEDWTDLQNGGPLRAVLFKIKTSR